MTYEELLTRTADRSNGSVSIPGLGKFTVEERKESYGRDISTGKPRTFPAHRVVKFRPASELKRAVKGE